MQQSRRCPATERFGEQIDVKVVMGANGQQNNDSQTSGRQIAGYLAKYVTKSVADFGIAMGRVSPGAIDQLDATDHVREILRAIATISAEDPYTDMIAWLHTLGYRGHIISKSRQFSTTMTALRDRRTEWRKSQTRDAVPATAWGPTDEPIPWRFQRSGHVSLGDRVLAVSASGRAQEERIAARQAAKEGG